MWINMPIPMQEIQMSKLSHTVLICSLIIKHKKQIDQVTSVLKYANYSTHAKTQHTLAQELMEELYPSTTV